MGGTCLRGHGHPWPPGGPSRAAAGGWQQGGLARQPDAAGHARAGPHLLRAGRDPDAVRLTDSEDQPDTVPHANGVAVGVRVRVGEPVGDRDPERLADSLPIADRHGDAIGVAEWQPESLELALAGVISAGRRDFQELPQNQRASPRPAKKSSPLAVWIVSRSSRSG